MITENQVAIYTGTITTKSNLSHNSDESMGIDSVYRRNPFFCQGKRQDVPIYSGNAIRGKLRRIAADAFLKMLGIQGISAETYHIYFTGGLLAKGSSQTEIDVGGFRAMRENIPWLSIWGSAVINKMLQGKLEVGMGVPICRETVEFTRVQSERSFHEMLTSVFYTRKDDYDNSPYNNDVSTTLIDKKDKDEQAHQMKYNVEVLIPGTVLHHRFVLKNCSDVELSCFGDVIERFNHHPVLGGNARIGHGIVELAYEPGFRDGALYREYVAEHKEKIIDYIRGNFV